MIVIWYDCERSSKQGRKLLKREINLRGGYKSPFKGRLSKEKEGKDKSIQDDDMVSTDKEQEQSW